MSIFVLLYGGIIIVWVIFVMWKLDNLNNRLVDLEKEE